MHKVNTRLRLECVYACTTTDRERDDTRETGERANVASASRNVRRSTASRVVVEDDGNV